jgi:hypothetical protein
MLHIVNSALEGIISLCVKFGLNISILCTWALFPTVCILLCVISRWQVKVSVNTTNVVIQSVSTQIEFLFFYRFMFTLHQASTTYNAHTEGTRTLTNGNNIFTSYTQWRTLHDYQHTVTAHVVILPHNLGRNNSNRKRRSTTWLSTIIHTTWKLWTYNEILTSYPIILAIINLIFYIQ